MKAFLLLGRLGDLTTLLPVLKDEADRTQQPTKLVVAKAYAHLLDGCSYVEPLVFDGDFYEVPQAKAWAARRLSGYDLVDCSVYGRTVNPSHDMWSFNREIWRLSRTPLNFDTAKPVFDRRDPQREQELLRKWLITVDPHPYILFAGRGTSSPFAQAPEYFAAAKKLAEAANHDLVDISDLQATRPYDLLGLYERAAGLIATDSFPLHLAQATPELPVLALLCDGPTPWHRSACRPNHVVRCLYGDALRHVAQDVAHLLHPVRPRMIFVTSQTPTKDIPTQARVARSEESRRREGLTEWINFQPVARDARQLGDRTPLPFVRDMIEAAVAASSGPQDIVVIANADIGVVEGTTLQLREKVSQHGCAYTHRWDFNGGQLARRLPRFECDLRQAQWYPGSDFFAFTVAWWQQHGHLFPDMVLGREAWDMLLRNLMKMTTGGDSRCEVHTAIWHERHASPWEQNLRLPGNEHNRRLATTWLARYGGSWNDWQGPQRYRAG